MRKYVIKSNVFLLLLSIFFCGTIGFFFSTLLDFFPWGSNDAYVIWEPLLVYYLIPCFVLLGFLRLILIRKTRYFFSKITFFIASVLLYIPSFIGFDLPTDIFSRWIGVICPLILILIFLFEIKVWINMMKQSFPA